MKRLLLAVGLLALAAGLHPASAQHAVLPGWDARQPRHGRGAEFGVGAPRAALAAPAGGPALALALRCRRRGRRAEARSL